MYIRWGPLADRVPRDKKTVRALTTGMYERVRHRLLHMASSTCTFTPQEAAQHSQHRFQAAETGARESKWRRQDESAEIDAIGGDPRPDVSALSSGHTSHRASQSVAVCGLVSLEHRTDSAYKANASCTRTAHEYDDAVDLVEAVSSPCPPSLCLCGAGVLSVPPTRRAEVCGAPQSLCWFTYTDAPSIVASGRWHPQRICHLLPPIVHSSAHRRRRERVT